VDDTLSFIKTSFNLTSLFYIFHSCVTTCKTAHTYWAKA